MTMLKDRYWSSIHDIDKNHREFEYDNGDKKVISNLAKSGHEYEIRRKLIPFDEMTPHDAELLITLIGDSKSDNLQVIKYKLLNWLKLNSMKMFKM